LGTQNAKALRGVLTPGDSAGSRGKQRTIPVDRKDDHDPPRTLELEQHRSDLGHLLSRKAKKILLRVVREPGKIHSMAMLQWDERRHGLTPTKGQWAGLRRAEQYRVKRRRKKPISGLSRGKKTFKPGREGGGEGGGDEKA